LTNNDKDLPTCLFKYHTLFCTAAYVIARVEVLAAERGMDSDGDKDGDVERPALADGCSG